MRISKGWVCFAPRFWVAMLFWSVTLMFMGCGAGPSGSTDADADAAASTDTPAPVVTTEQATEPPVNTPTDLAALSAQGDPNARGLAAKPETAPAKESGETPSTEPASEPQPEKPDTPVTEPTEADPAPQPSDSASFEARVAAYQAPPQWLAEVSSTWDMKRPWKEGRVEIRRLLGVNKESARKEAVKLMWEYKQKGDMGNEHEYPMYTRLGQEPIWSVLAHRYFLAKEHENPPVYAMHSFAGLLAEFGQFEEAEEQLNDAMDNVPGPPWTEMRRAEYHDAFGDLYSSWGKLDLAKEHYLKAIAIFPTAKPPYGGHLLKRRAKKVQSKLDLLSFTSLESAKLRDGRYQEKALGYSGDVHLTVTVAEGRIADIQVRHQEKIEQNAVVLVPERIISKQSLIVDGVSGATVTKDAIVGGTYRALKQAGLR